MSAKRKREAVEGTSNKKAHSTAEETKSTSASLDAAASDDHELLAEALAPVSLVAFLTCGLAKGRAIRWPIAELVRVCFVPFGEESAISLEQLIHRLSPFVNGRVHAPPIVRASLARRAKKANRGVTKADTRCATIAEACGLWRAVIASLVKQTDSRVAAYASRAALAARLSDVLELWVEIVVRQGGFARSDADWFMRRHVQSRVWIASGEFFSNTKSQTWSEPANENSWARKAWIDHSFQSKIGAPDRFWLAVAPREVPLLKARFARCAGMSWDALSRAWLRADRGIFYRRDASFGPVLAWADFASIAVLLLAARKASSTGPLLAGVQYPSEVGLGFFVKQFKLLLRCASRTIGEDEDENEGPALPSDAPWLIASCFFILYGFLPSDYQTPNESAPAMRYRTLAPYVASDEVLRACIGGFGMRLGRPVLDAPAGLGYPRLNIVLANAWNFLRVSRQLQSRSPSSLSLSLSLSSSSSSSSSSSLSSSSSSSSSPAAVSRSTSTKRVFFDACVPLESFSQSERGRKATQMSLCERCDFPGNSWTRSPSRVPEGQGKECPWHLALSQFLAHAAKRVVQDWLCEDVALCVFAYIGSGLTVPEWADPSGLSPAGDEKVDAQLTASYAMLRQTAVRKISDSGFLTEAFASSHRYRQIRLLLGELDACRAALELFGVAFFERAFGCLPPVVAALRDLGSASFENRYGDPGISAYVPEEVQRAVDEATDGSDAHRCTDRTNNNYDYSPPDPAWLTEL